MQILQGQERNLVALLYTVAQAHQCSSILQYEAPIHKVIKKYRDLATMFDGDM